MSLLGGFELRRDEAVVQLPASASRLVALLALRDRPTARSYVAGLLWPDAAEPRANASLRSLLWRANRPAAALIEAANAHLALARSVTTDVRELIAASERVARGSTEAADRDLAAIRRAEDLLPGWYEDWVVLERERLRVMRLHALEALCEHLTAAGNGRQAVAAGLAAVEAEPLRESAQRALVRAELAEGNRAEATRHYERYRRLLWDELGLRPSEQMEDLVRSLRADLGRRRPDGA